ncbi:hypothetical protein ACFLRW_04065 [Acidobacteriota bacterium]
MTTLDPTGANLIGKLILEILKPYEFDAVGGYTLGAEMSAFLPQGGKPISHHLLRYDPFAVDNHSFMDQCLASGATSTCE